MLLGYNTNGLAHHDPFAAIGLLHEIGYRSVAITLDHGELNPFGLQWSRQRDRLQDLLRLLEMRSVIETGARYLLDPWHKHEPTLLSDDPVRRGRRLDFLRRAVDTAAALGSDCVSLWSGVRPEQLAPQAALERLADGLRTLLEYADARGVVLGFEPEPGMLIDTLESFRAVAHQVGGSLRLTLDIGHLHCLREWPLAEHIQRWGAWIVNVHLEDMRAGAHEHLPFGQGEIDFPPVWRALAATGYRGGIHVELSRHSHVGPQAAHEAYAFLTALAKR